ncbi:unnamed protein product, partial [Phaeothamnion confervicola]
MPFHFHRGKLAVQHKAGVSADAAHALSAGWLGERISASGDVQMSNLETREVYITSIDEQGRVWTSPVSGANPGFLEHTVGTGNKPDTLTISAPADRGFLTFEGDPLLVNLAAVPLAPVGVLLMSHKFIRRYRVDGRVTALRRRHQTS